VIHRRTVVLVGLWLLAVTGAWAEPALRCLWTPPRAVRVPAGPGVARVQYTQFFDDAVASALERSLGADRTLRFRYETEYPDDHVFPNGVSMGRIHEWLTALLEAWNREPLMPVRLRLERGQPATENTIFLDDTSSETTPNSGRGGYSYEFDGETIQFTCRAALNVDAGSVTRRELFDALARHELGHCLALRHSSSRSAMMGYSTGSVDYGASMGYISLDDLLGLRSVWDRNAPGFGSLVGHLLYEDGTPVGGGDVVAIDAATGDVLATGVSDGSRDGYFRIELPAGRQVRLIAHPLHADAAILGEHFLPSELITPKRFAPTELKEHDESVVLTVPDGSSTELADFTVSDPPSAPLENRDAPVVALSPGERAHAAFQLSAPADADIEVHTSLAGLTVSHVTRVEDRVEFDVAAAPESAGVSLVEFRSGGATNVQVGTLWVRPLTGVVRATGVEPSALTRGETTEVTVRGVGLERVTGARLVTEEGDRELEGRLVGQAEGDRLRLAVEVPADAPNGPWNLVILTPEGEAGLSPEPRPRLWVTPGRVEAQAMIDLGEVKVGEPLDLTVQLTNRSTTAYRATNYNVLTWQGEVELGDWKVSPRLEPGGSGRLELQITPRQLGLTVATFLWQSEDEPDAVTEVRLWGLP
jgi:hypothetical protein